MELIHVVASPLGACGVPCAVANHTSTWTSFRAVVTALLSYVACPSRLLSWSQDGAYDTPERVMKAAQRMAAQLLAAEPGIREFVRREFMASAVVTTGANSAPHAVADNHVLPTGSPCVPVIVERGAGTAMQRYHD